MLVVAGLFCRKLDPHKSDSDLQITVDMSWAAIKQHYRTPEIETPQRIAFVRARQEIIQRTDYTPSGFASPELPGLKFRIKHQDNPLIVKLRKQRDPRFTQEQAIHANG
jgi:hypothetical protein